MSPEINAPLLDVLMPVGERWLPLVLLPVLALLLGWLVAGSSWLRWSLRWVNRLLDVDIAGGKNVVAPRWHCR